MEPGFESPYRYHPSFSSITTTLTAAWAFQPDPNHETLGEGFSAIR